jgi:hypothetical protein
VLRVLNIGMLGSGLVLFRRVLQQTRLSAPLVNTSLLLFVLIPITPQLAAHINYDNVFVPLVAAVCLLMFRFMEQLRQRQVDVRTLLVGLSVCLLGSLVKYAFLPILAAVAIWTLVAFCKYFRHHWRQLWPAIGTGWQAMSRNARVGVVVLLVVSAGLFVQRFGVNMLAHKTPIPSCDAVLSTDECSAYGPWYRNYTLEQERDDTRFSHNPLIYTGEWLYWLWYRLFFAINGPTHAYANYPPLPLPSHAAVVLTVVGLAAVAAYARVLWRDWRLLFMAIISIAYVAALWAEDYSQYLETGNPVAINGRYLLPVLLLAAAIMGHAFSRVLARRAQLKPIMAAAVLLLFLQGGGALTFILRSDNTWYWPNATVRHVNSAARRALSPIIIEGSKQYSGARWY